MSPVRAIHRPPDPADTLLMTNNERVIDLTDGADLTAQLHAPSDGVHLYSPAGDQRERSVRCWCGAWTWNICARCADHCEH